MYQKLFSRCTCYDFFPCSICLQYVCLGIAIITGLILLRYPKQIINFQITFYRLINWRIEPISMEKEIRNTRIMAMLTLLISIVGFIVIIM